MQLQCARLHNPCFEVCRKRFDDSCSTRASEFPSILTTYPGTDHIDPNPSRPLLPSCDTCPMKLVTDSDGACQKLHQLESDSWELKLPMSLRGVNVRISITKASDTPNQFFVSCIGLDGESNDGSPHIEDIIFWPELFVFATRTCKSTPKSTNYIIASRELLSVIRHSAWLSLQALLRRKGYHVTCRRSGKKYYPMIRTWGSSTSSTCWFCGQRWFVQDQGESPGCLARVEG